jgi:hypothetical protein
MATQSGERIAELARVASALDARAPRAECPVLAHAPRGTSSHACADGRRDMARPLPMFSWQAKRVRAVVGRRRRVVYIAVSALSHIGAVRDHHEDSLVAGPWTLCATVTESPQMLVFPLGTPLMVAVADATPR